MRLTLLASLLVIMGACCPEQKRQTGPSFAAKSLVLDVNKQLDGFRQQLQQQPAYHFRYRAAAALPNESRLGIKVWLEDPKNEAADKFIIFRRQGLDQPYKATITAERPLSVKDPRKKEEVVPPQYKLELASSY